MRTSLRNLFFAAAFVSGCGAQPAVPAGVAANDAAKIMKAVPASIADESFLKDYAETFRFRLGRPSQIKVTPDGDAVLFLRAAGPRSFVQDLWTFDPATGEVQQMIVLEQGSSGQEPSTPSPSTPSTPSTPSPGSTPDSSSGY